MSKHQSLPPIAAPQEPIYLYNSAAKSKQPFSPLHPDKKRIGMYVCGPTVYSYAHIGNARPVVIYDLLFRILKARYHDYHVKYVRNITDVDDKINAAALESLKENRIPATRENILLEIKNITHKNTQYFHDDIASLHTLPPTHEPRATEYINDIIAIIQKIIDSGNAYIADGHVLFDVTTYSGYGKLSGRDLDDMIAGARVEVANYKKHPADFVLWKPSSEHEPAWPSPWGDGRPGWHSECVAMSTELLGQDFDIHGGGDDLLFPHHENEICQGCTAYPGSTYAKYWVHNGLVTINGQKMSKSLGNIYTIQDLLLETNKDGLPDKKPSDAMPAISGVALRYFLLSAHYRKPLDLSEKSLHDAEKAIHKLYQPFINIYEYNNYILDDLKAIKSDELNNIITGEDLKPFWHALYDDMNSPAALAWLHSQNKHHKNEIFNIIPLYFGLNFLGLYDEDIIKNTINSNKNIKHDIPAEIIELAEARISAKENKDFARADELRDKIIASGWQIIDTGKNSYELKRD